MATISSAGIGSGLDINGIITQLMNVEKQPLLALDTKEASYQAKLSAFGSLKGAISSLQSSARALKSTTLYAAMAAQSSSSATLTASANTAAATGTYAIEVIAKAQAQSISSRDFASITSDLSTIDGKIKIELGTYDEAPPASFTADPAKTPVTIDIAANESSLEEIRDKINSANAGVRANLVYVGSAGYKLTLTSNDTGATTSIKLTTLDSGNNVLTDNNDIAKLSFDPTQLAGAGNEFDINVGAQDAHLKIDGLSIYRKTNTVSDAITGVTLTLATAGNATVTISKDTAAAKSAFDTFVKAYNDTNKLLRDLTTFNTQTGLGAILTGDSGARSLQSALRSLITTGRTAAGEPRNLSDLGISMQRDGSLQFDSGKLASAMASSATQVSALMTTDNSSDNGLAVRMTSALDGILSSNGILASRTDGINRSIADVDDRRELLARRLTQIEARYRKQFTALDTLVASMQKTSQYLTQQLANLPSTTSA